MYTGNIFKNSKAYCLVSVCSCFVTIFEFYFFFSTNTNLVENSGYGVAGSCFTDVMYIVRTTTT